MTKEKKKMALHVKILLGLLIGVIGGAIVQYLNLSEETVSTINSFVKPVGDIFLRMIFMMIIPLILTALSLGIAELGDLKKVGRLGLKMLGFTLIVTSISVFIGIGMVKIFEPGKSLNIEDRQFLLNKFADKAVTIKENAEDARSKSIGDIFTTFVPKNPFEDMARAFDPTYHGGGLLAVMFFALILGAAISVSDPVKVLPVKNFLEGFYEVVVKALGFAMNLAPYGVAALMYGLTSTMGLSILLVLAKYVLVVLGALAIHQFITYSLILKYMANTSPVFFFKNASEAMITAFSTSSSNATLPTAIRVTIEKLKVPKQITHFVLTIGSTANQNGTALYEGVTVLFLAQCFGVDLSIVQQIFVVVISILAGIGTAGVPGGSLPVIMLILISIGVPGESIILIYGVDRILDMSRTVLNVTGDMAGAVYLYKTEKKGSIEKELKEIKE